MSLLLFPHPPFFPSPYKSISPTIALPLTFIPHPRPPIHTALVSQSLYRTHPPLRASPAPPSPPETAAAATGEEEDLTASPWEGAVVYRRDASAAHLEYCTTLERLGLGRLSSGLSQSRASEMGIRLPAVRTKDASAAAGTPVLISLDVTRRKRRLKLDGILRTVITLGCNRCAGPAAECVFSNFTLLLTEDPIEEPEKINLGTIFGDDKFKTFSGSGNGEGEEYEEEIDLDDRLYFPSEEKEIDISKQIRDIVHVEITINSICDPSCKGLCLRCGINLNKGRCNCSKEKFQEKHYGPLKSLRKKMQ